MRLVKYTIGLLAILILCLGCSGTNSPMGDFNARESVSGNVDNLSPVAVSDWASDGTASAGQGILGLYDVSINVDNLQGEITPVRKTASTDVLEVVDITNFMQIAPCVGCVKLSGISLNADNQLVLAIGVKHPFPAGDPFKPVSGKNRADLHVFNIEGTIISDGTGIVSFTSLGKTIGLVNLLNADGYTGYLDSKLDEIQETQANLHPYILHFDDYSQGNFRGTNPMGFESVTNPPPSGNLVMPMGSDYNVQDYIFDIENGTLEFFYAVGCTYAISAAGKSQRLTPEYRVPQHLKKAASEVHVEITRNELMTGSPTSEADITVNVVDLSNGVQVGENLDQMLNASDVSSVSIEIPGILTSAVVNATSSGGTGHDPSDPVIYNFTIQNQGNAESGTYHGLVKVLDSYSPGSNQLPVLNGMDGIGRVGPLDNPLSALFAIDEFATYQVFTIDVSFENNNPVVDAVEGCARVIAGLPFLFTVTANDPDPGQTLTYYWDNGENTPGVYDDATTSINETELTFTNAGTYTVDVRVDDGVGGSATSSNPLEVTVLPSGIFVDADYTGGSNDGSFAHPFINIGQGINAVSSGYVYVLPATAVYAGFTTKSNMVVMGFDLTCGLERPTVLITSDTTLSTGASNTTISSFIFNVNISTGGSTRNIMVLSGGSNVTLENCRITGECDANFSYFLKFSGITNGMLRDNEFVDILFDGLPTYYRYGYVLQLESCSAFTIMHNEMHHVGIPDTGVDNFWSGIYCISAGGNSNTVIKNNLVYDIYDASQTTPRPTPQYTDMCNVIHFAYLSAPPTAPFQLLNNTIDDINAIARGTTENGWSVGTYGDANGVYKNNIFKSLHYYVGPGVGHWDAGFWADGAPEANAEYSCVYRGQPIQGPSQVADYLNRVHKGVGSYGLYDYVDPNFDYTPGANYYHPQNGTIAIGGEDGSEMGCFGGPDGNWTPPSQIYY